MSLLKSNTARHLGEQLIYQLAPSNITITKARIGQMSV